MSVSAFSVTGTPGFEQEATSSCLSSLVLLTCSACLLWLANKYPSDFLLEKLDVLVLRQGLVLLQQSPDDFSLQAHLFLLCFSKVFTDRIDQTLVMADQRWYSCTPVTSCSRSHSGHRNGWLVGSNLILVTEFKLTSNYVIICQSIKLLKKGKVPLKITALKF